MTNLISSLVRGFVDQAEVDVFVAFIHFLVGGNFETMDDCK